MLQVNAGGCAIVLAHADNGVRPSRCVKVIGQRIWMEEVGRFWLARGVRGKPCFRCCTDKHLGEWVRLGEPEPMVVAQGKSHVGALEMLDGGDDVEHGQPENAFRVIECK